MRNFHKQEEMRFNLSNIHQTSQANLAKLQDDYLKLTEINRLLGNAIEVLILFKLFSIKLPIRIYINMVKIYF